MTSRITCRCSYYVISLNEYRVVKRVVLSMCSDVYAYVKRNITTSTRSLSDLYVYTSSTVAWGRVTVLLGHLDGVSLYLIYFECPKWINYTHLFVINAHFI